MPPFATMVTIPPPEEACTVLVATSACSLASCSCMAWACFMIFPILPRFPIHPPAILPSVTPTHPRHAEPHPFPRFTHLPFHSPACGIEMSPFPPLLLL